MFYAIYKGLFIPPPLSPLFAPATQAYKISHFNLIMFTRKVGIPHLLLTGPEFEVK